MTARRSKRKKNIPKIKLGTERRKARHMRSTLLRRQGSSGNYKRGRKRENGKNKIKEACNN